MMSIDIVSKIVKFKPDLRVAIVGTGELESEVKNKCKALKLENNIKFYGFQNNPYGLLKSTRLMCVTSLWEGFGLAVAEALILGKPVVSTSVGGIKDILTANCGYFCSEKLDFVNAIKELLINESVLKTKSINAKSRAAELNNVKAYIYKIKELYRLLVKN